MTDTELMLLAIDEAKKAALEGEVPVGAVVALEGRPIAFGRNKRENGKNALYHAEIIAIDRACKAKHGWRLSDCDIFVTMEPCPMCAGAIINARFNRCVFGCFDEKAGAFGGLVDFNAMGFNHRPEIISGVLCEECRELLRDFFEKRRT